ncbi:MAG: DUF2358 domain-containing protein [Cyanobacteria bacterium P01_F01_bin.33]
MSPARATQPIFSPAELIAILKADYSQFPKQQTYDIYAEDVLFVDPLNRFSGINRYRKMIGWMDRWFREVHLDLHDIELQNNLITTRWTLRWRAPLPWQPGMAIDGWSELELNATGKIQSHTDYWHTRKWDVLKQLFDR